MKSGKVFLGGAALAPKWHGVVTLLSLSFCFTLLAVTSLVLQDVDYALLVPRTPLPQATVFGFTLSSSLPYDTGMHTLLTPVQ